MKPSLVSNYIILWIHLMSLSLRLFYESKLVNFFKLDLDEVNIFLNNIFTSDFVFDNGSIDILLIFTLLGSFYLGRYYPESLIYLFTSTLLLEVLIIYNEKPGRIITILLFMLVAYLLGKYTKKDKSTYLLEKHSANKDILNYPNIPEYATYKLY